MYTVCLFIAMTDETVNTSISVETETVRIKLWPWHDLIHSMKLALCGKFRLEVF